MLERPARPRAGEGLQVDADVLGRQAPAPAWQRDQPDGIPKFASGGAVTRWAHRTTRLPGRRVDLRQDWLVNQAGLDRSRIQVIAFEASAPVQPNDSDEHRQANRRVVIAVER